ncbi:MAG: hypothetical protein E6J02_00515 [Chloroflexi bacterium]|nr:MAG: hypothetical protein E6J02_00515 [Chloroflexota bacterium]TME13956.1 MAG: hypothetical protein E6I63_14195 [Chloroflexota bacterium]TME20732.1 MAG: hypothetical protein E6I70_00735 [Chloroflexota bacterium]
MGAEVAELLQGEDPNSRHIDDAWHWTAVYVELLQFAEGHAPERVDLYRSRLQFWRKRELDLTAEPAGRIGAPT